MWFGMPVLDSGEHRAQRDLDHTRQPHPVLRRRVGGWRLSSRARRKDVPLGTEKPPGPRVLHSRTHRVLDQRDDEPAVLRAGRGPTALEKAPKRPYEDIHDEGV